MGSLLAATLDILCNHRPKTLPEIAIDTGLPYYWIRKMASNEIKDPGVNRVQKLYEYLTRTSLPIEKP